MHAGPWTRFKRGLRPFNDYGGVIGIGLIMLFLLNVILSIK